MSIQHAQARIEMMRPIYERLEYGRFGPRIRTRSQDTPESNYAAAYLSWKLGQRNKEPDPRNYWRKKESHIYANKIKIIIENELSK